MQLFNFDEHIFHLQTFTNNTRLEVAPIIFDDLVSFCPLKYWAYLTITRFLRN